MTNHTAHASTEAPNKKTVILIFVGLMVSMLMASLGQTVLSTALPTIVGELGGVDQMTWVITGYILATTIVMPIVGSISDLFGRKPVIVASILLFIGGSIVGALSTSIGMLIVTRVVQGMGGGGLMVLSQSAVADVIPARERGKYMGILGASFAVSSVAGPLLGGWLTEGPGWRWTFWLNVPLGILALIATAVFLHLPKVKQDVRPKIDYAGMALVSIATTAIVLTVTWGGNKYDWTSPQILELIGVAVVASIATVWVESKAENPVLPLGMFKNLNFSLTTLVGLLTGVAMFGVIGYMPTYIQMVSGVDATHAGFLMIPLMMSLLISSIVSGALVSKTGKYKAYPIVGVVLIGVGLFLVSTLEVHSATWIMCTYLSVFGVGLGLSQQILTLIVQNEFPAAVVGTATSSFNYFKQVGATVGSAIVGAFFANRLRTFLTENLAGLGTAGSGTNTTSLTPGAVLELPDAIREPIILSYNEALLPIFLGLVPVVIAALIVTFFLKEKPLATQIERGIPAEALSEGQLLVTAEDEDLDVELAELDGQQADAVESLRECHDNRS